jgi:hypothetical protein
MGTVDTVIHASERLDYLLQTNFCAVGDELGTKLRSVESGFPDELVQALRHVDTLRQRVRSEPDFQLDDEERLRREVQFLAAVLSEPAHPHTREPFPIRVLRTQMIAGLHLLAVLVTLVVAWCASSLLPLESVVLQLISRIGPLGLVVYLFPKLLQRRVEKADARCRATLRDRMRALKRPLR